MAVSKRLRYEVLRRDNHACRYCGATAPDVKLTVDHVVAVALGGSDDPSNLVAACVDCNSGKSASPADAALVADVNHKALLWAAAIKAAADEVLADIDAKRQTEEDFLSLWNCYSFGPDWNKQQVPLPPDWRESLHRFVAAGLPILLIADAVQIAMGSRARTEETFRYFCGVCWRKLADLQERAYNTLGDQ